MWAQTSPDSKGNSVSTYSRRHYMYTQLENIKKRALIFQLASYSPTYSTKKHPKLSSLDSTASSASHNRRKREITSQGRKSVCVCAKKEFTWDYYYYKRDISLPPLKKLQRNLYSADYRHGSKLKLQMISKIIVN